MYFVVEWDTTFDVISEAGSHLITYFFKILLYLIKLIISLCLSLKMQKQARYKKLQTHYDKTVAVFIIYRIFKKMIITAFTFPKKSIISYSFQQNKTQTWTWQILLNNKKGQFTKRDIIFHYTCRRLLMIFLQTE